MPKEFRFAIGSIEGLRSTVWKLWSSKGDVYIQSRMMGYSTKVSLHESLECQYSITKEWVDKNPDREIHPDSRHLQKWKREAPTNNRAILAFRIIIPNSELRKIEVKEKFKKISWLPIPPSGHSKIVECYYAPEGFDKTVHNNFPYNFLTSFDLQKMGHFVVLVHDQKNTKKDEDQLVAVKTFSRNKFKEKGEEIKPQYRGSAIAVGQNGERAMIEIVLKETEHNKAGGGIPESSASSLPPL